MNEQWRRDRQNFLLTPILPGVSKEQSSAGCLKQLSDSAPLIDSRASLFTARPFTLTGWKGLGGLSLMGGLSLTTLACGGNSKTQVFWYCYAEARTEAYRAGRMPKGLQILPSQRLD